MAKFTGTGGKDNFKGGPGKDSFVFDVDHLSAKDKLAGAGGLDALLLVNDHSSSWVSVSAKQWHGLSGIEGVGLLAYAGTYGFKLAFDNSFYKTNGVKTFEIVGTTLSGFAQGLHVSAAKVGNMAFKIDGTMAGEDLLKTGKGDDTFVYIEDTFDVRDTIDAGGGRNTLIFAGAGKSTPIKDGGVYVSPDAHSFLADVRNIDEIIVSNLDKGQSRTIEFGNLAGSAHYTGKGTVTIETQEDYAKGKKGDIAGALIVEGSRLTTNQAIDAAGGSGDDRLTGGDGKDRLAGSAGDDRLEGGKGDDALSGGDGNDTLTGGLGGDVLAGGDGDDLFIFSDTTFGSAAGQFFKDKIDGGAGSDTLAFTDESGVSISAADLADNGVTGIETIRLSGTDSNRIVLTQYFLANNHDADGYLHIVSGSPVPGNPTDLTVDASAVSGNALAINVEIYGTGNDTLSGGAGDDIFSFVGSLTNSGISGADFADKVVGGGGADTILVNAGATAVFGTGVSGIEAIRVVDDGTQSITGIDFAGSGAMTIDGSSLGAQQGLFARGFAEDPDDPTTAHDATGALTFLGGKGNDTFVGGLGDDVMTGGDGNDLFYGRLGADTLTGGDGADDFLYADATDSTVAAAGSDRITDFSQADGDRIYFLHDDPFADPFVFIEDDEFGNNAGEVRSFIDGNKTIVQLDRDGDGSADFQLVLTGQIELAASDFSL